ncbi:sensor histidine kinase [Mucilaginibacter lacusdianchii]|uniref:sensor histidine kinase n=1 Tax=Mucilaginibacter lacusdianchii TaxID=2684211 RepID=UPI00131D2F9F|nr:HAMP domain-containing sensor histidine kinase [Mucilaginibacter sp. JXJ CY 39]
MQTQLELYQRVTPLVGLGIFEHNFQTGEVYWNPIVKSILEVGNEYDSNLEDSINLCKHPEQIRELLSKAMASGEPETGTFQITTPITRKHKWVRIHLQATCDKGECASIYGALEDVTQRAEVIALLKEREKLFTNAFDFAPIGLALVSLTGGWIKVNLSLCKMLGYTEQEFLKHTFQDFTHPDDLNKDLQLLQELLDGKVESYNMEKRYYHADGYIIWAMLSVSLIRDELGQPMYFVSQIKDVTERKKHMETIQSQNDRLLNFAHIVSHNLRSHTGNMKMLTDMILLEHDEEEKERLLLMLNENTSNILETLEYLNEVVKVHDNVGVGKVSLHLKPAVQRVLDILSASIQNEEAEITLAIPDDCCIQFHPAYLESVIMNLISNALKYKHPDRQANISITAERFDRQILFKVKDNGLGIDLSLHGHKLFGMYKTFHRHPDARGMGLFLVKNQVEAMGGSISAESTPNCGTTFIVRFELYENKAAEHSLHH